MAVTLPVLVVLVLGSIEATNAIFLKQAMTMAAYEGARTASAPGTTASTAERRCQEVLDARGISRARITISPRVNAKTATGTEIRVTVTAPASSNSVGVSRFFVDSTLTASVVMVRL